MLARQRRSLAVLTVAVLAINAGLSVLLLFFLRHLLAPWETLLARARQVGGAGEAGADEIEFLLATFERALAALAGRPGRTAEDDIAALERTLSASLQSGLLLIDREGRVLALNAVGAALLGAALPEPGAPLAAGARGPARAARDPARPAPRRAGARSPAPGVPRCGRAPGAAETLTVGLTVHPLRRDDGEVRGLLVLFADLTEAQRRAEESRLAESLAQLGEMAGGVAHELRNGLATLRGYLTLIERRPDEDSIADFLSEIRGEADHLERVLAGLPLLRPAGHRPGGRALAPPAAAARRGRPCARRRRGARRRGRRSSCAATPSSSSAPCATSCTTRRRPSGRRDGGDRSRSRSPSGPRGSRSPSRTAAPGCRTRSGRASSTPSPPAGAAASGWGSRSPIASSCCTAAASGSRTGPAAGRGRCSSSLATQSLRLRNESPASGAPGSAADDCSVNLLLSAATYRPF